MMITKILYLHEEKMNIQMTQKDLEMIILHTEINTMLDILKKGLVNVPETRTIDNEQ